MVICGDHGKLRSRQHKVQRSLESNQRLCETLIHFVADVRYHDDPSAFQAAIAYRLNERRHHGQVTNSRRIIQIAQVPERIEALAYAPGTGQAVSQDFRLADEQNPRPGVNLLQRFPDR